MCRAWPSVFNADSTYESALGAKKLVLFIPVMLVATKPGNTDCTIIPCALYSVDKSSENLSTNACNEINHSQSVTQLEEKTMASLSLSHLRCTVNGKHWIRNGAGHR